jgi:hypothetical protein
MYRVFPFLFTVFKVSIIVIGPFFARAIIITGLIFVFAGLRSGYRASSVAVVALLEDYYSYFQSNLAGYFCG